MQFALIVKGLKINSGRGGETLRAPILNHFNVQLVVKLEVSEKIGGKVA